MENFTIYKLIIIMISACLSLWLVGDLIGRETPSPGFELVGPPETADLEIALDRRLGGYAWGIWPRPEKLKGALPGSKLPPKYIDRLKIWIPLIIRKELLPEKIDPNQFYGLPRLRSGEDFIIGELHNPKQNVTIQFQADGTSLVFIAISKSYFPNDVNNLADSEIVRAITSLVNYPQDKLGNIIVEKHIEHLGQGEGRTLVCYGKLRDADFDEMKPPIPPRRAGEKSQNVRTWWNYLPFWVAKGKIFIASTMVDWDTIPASLDWYVFKLSNSEENQPNK